VLSLTLPSIRRNLTSPREFIRCWVWECIRYNYETPLPPYEVWLNLLSVVAGEGRVRGKYCTLNLLVLLKSQLKSVQGDHLIHLHLKILTPYIPVTSNVDEIYNDLIFCFEAKPR